MKLKEYLRKAKLTPIEFAERIGVDQSSAYRWLEPDCVPTLRNRYKVEAATDGLVTVGDWGDGDGAGTDQLKASS